MTHSDSGSGLAQGELLTIRNIIIAAALICLAGGLIGMFFVPPLKWWLGCVFGYAVNLLCFRLLYLDIEKSVTKQKTAAKTRAFAGYFGRYVIKGAALYASIQSPLLCMGSCIIGLLSINAAIHVLNILNIYFAKSKERE
ncbi:MAG: ATP synthase subunit I [Eubacteriaceae bacterium]|nr:ATP synthase subunit I [Eubacteriaceae bacterium]